MNFSVFLQWLGLFIALIVLSNLYFRFLAAFEHALFLTWMCLQLGNYAWWQKRHFKCACLTPYHSVWLLIFWALAAFELTGLFLQYLHVYVLVTGYPMVCNNIPSPWDQLLHLTPPHFSFNKSCQRMNFFGLFVDFISWKMYQHFCKFSLLHMLYIGGYTNFSENRNNSTRSSLIELENVGGVQRSLTIR